MNMYVSKKRLLAGVLSVMLLLTALLSIPMMTSANSTNLREQISAVKALFEDINSGSVSDTEHGNVTRILNSVHDGDISTSVDAYTAFGWDPPKNAGVRMELNATYYVEKLVLYSGSTSNPDVVKVYVSDKLADLYSEMNRVAAGLVCKGDAVTVNVDRNAKYVAIFITDGNDCWRTKEFEIYGSEALPSTNLRDSITEKKGVVQFTSSGSVSQETNPVTDDIAAKIFDGDYDTQAFVNDPTSWNPVRYSGVLATLNTVYYLDKIVLYSGQTGYSDTLKVYASDSLDNLYTAENLIAENIVCEDHNEPVVVEIDKEAQYIAIFNTSGAWRPYEIEIHKASESEEEVATGLTGTGAGILGQTLINNKQGLRFNNQLVTSVVNGVETVTVDGAARQVTGIGMLVTKRADATLTVENAADASNGILQGRVTSARSVVVKDNTVTYQFSILVKNVDYANVNTMITSRAYVEYLDGDGETKVLYGDVQTTSVQAMYKSLPSGQFSDTVKNWMAGGSAE